MFVNTITPELLEIITKFSGLHRMVKWGLFRVRGWTAGDLTSVILLCKGGTPRRLTRKK